MKKGICRLEIIFLLVLALVLSFGTYLEKQQQDIAGTMIRLHVKANSNSPEDQHVKLLVRDAVLEFAENKLSGCRDRSDAFRVLQENLSGIVQAANEVLLEVGVSDRAGVTLERELFSTRYYDTFALPGGYYDALRVNIGAGAGENWWCVVYPRLCTASVTETDSAVTVMGTEGASFLFPDETGEYSLRFKTLEIFENIMGWFRLRDDGIPTSP